MRPNWFLALPVPAGGWFPAQLSRPPAGLRLFAPGDLHLTMAFLGACGPRAAQAAFEESSACELPATRIRFGSLGPMGRASRFSVLALSLSLGGEAIERQMRRHRDRWLEIAGARPERRRPKAHVSLGRVLSRAGEAQRRAMLEWARQVELEHIELELTELALYTWSDERPAKQFRIVCSRAL